MNKELLNEVISLLEQCGEKVDKAKELYHNCESSDYKYILSEDFNKHLSNIINDNRLIDSAFEYIESARNISKNTIWWDIEIVQDMTKIVTVNALTENGIQWIVDLLTDYLNTINDIKEYESEEDND